MIAKGTNASILWSNLTTTVTTESHEFGLPHKTPRSDHLGTVWLVYHYLWLHHRPAYRLLPPSLMPYSWVGIRIFTRTGFLAAAKSEGGFVWRPYTQDDEGSDASCVTNFFLCFSYVMRCSERFSCCLLLLAVRLSDKYPAYHLRYFVLCLPSYRYMCGWFHTRGTWDDLVSLGWRG